MKILTIYTPQNGEVLSESLNAVAALIQTDTFKAAIDIMLLFSGLMAAYQFISGNKAQVFARYIFTTFIALYCLLGIQVSVAIGDMQQEMKSDTVDHVPLGVALPAAIISQIGRAITITFGDVFHMPDDLDYNKAGMIFGSRTWLSSTQANYAMSPDVSRDLSSYIRQCIFASKLLASRKITASELINSANLQQLLFKNPSAVYRVIMHDGQNLSCAQAANAIKPTLNTATQISIEHLSRLMTGGNTQKYKDTLAAAHKYFSNESKSAAEIMTQNILINATRNAASDAFAFSGNDAALMNYTNSSSMQKMHVAEANSFWLASYRLPYYMSVFWILTLCIFPLVVLLSLFPVTQNVYKLYLQSQAYIWMWPPLFIIIHFFVSIAASRKLTLFGQGDLGGVSFSNIDALANIHSNFAYTAGALAASVPFLAYYLTKGLSSVLSNAAQHFGGMVQSMSTGEAQAAAMGNISMASYSGWNMNYDNTHAHKYDTNYSLAEGRITAQADNGAMVSQNTDSSHTLNSQPAISNIATSIHGSHRVIDSLQHSANESFSHAEQLRTSGDSHIQQGLSLLDQFNNSESNDMRAGAGASHNQSDSISQDLRKMQDAVTHYNHNHDKNHQMSLDGAVGAKIQSNRSVFGKAVEWATGMSGDASISGRTSVGLNHSAQQFMSSGEGKSFSEAFNHMQSTARTEHLDVNDSSQLSSSEQIAANFSKGQSLSEQAAQEYHHAESAQQAASHAKEHAQSIDSNFNQAFHDWVVDNYGTQGEQTLLKTDSRSLDTQRGWGESFLHSSAGESRIADEVHSRLDETSHLKENYQQQSAALYQQKHTQVFEQGNRDNTTVLDAAKEKGALGLSEHQIEQAHKLQKTMRNSDPLSQAQNNASQAQSLITDNQGDIEKSIDKNKVEFNKNNFKPKEWSWTTKK